MSNIILYTTHCPRCSVLENKLNAKNIKFSICEDVNTMLSMGMESTPMLSVDGKIMNFTEANNWVKEQ